MFIKHKYTTLICLFGVLIAYVPVFANKNSNGISSLKYFYPKTNVLGEIVCQPGINLTTLTEENTRYIIKYGYDLKGKRWVVPSGCILIFEGGYIDNGILVGNNTCLDAQPYQLFGEDLSIDGTWNVSIAYPEWFGAKGDGINDDRIAIQRCINSFDATHLFNKTYLLKSLSDIDKGICLNIPEFKTLEGEYVGNAISHINRPSTLQISSSLKPKCILHLEKGTNVIRNISISGNSKSQYANYASIREGDFDNQIIGIGTTGKTIRYNRFENIGIAYCYYAFKMSTWMTIFDNCSAKCCVYGMRITGGTTINARNCYMGSIIKSAYYISNVVYSKFETLAADGCGWGVLEKEGATSVFDDKTHYIYRIEDCNSVTFSNCGQEAGFRTISFASSEYCDISGFYLGAYQIKNDKIKRDAYIYVGKECRAITLRNIRHYIDGKFIKVEGYYNDTNVPKVIFENIGGPWGIDKNNIDAQEGVFQYLVRRDKKFLK